MEEERNRVRQQMKELGLPWQGLSLHDLKLQLRMYQSKHKPLVKDVPKEIIKEPISPLPEPEPLVELPGGDELLERYKVALQTMDELVRVEQRNHELIKEFQNVWNEADQKAFAMEDLFSQTQKVTLAREALDIQEKWGDTLRDREHAYTMMLENYSNGCGRVHDHIQGQIGDLRKVLVRFEEDKKRFNGIVLNTIPSYQEQMNIPRDEYNTPQL